MKAVIFLEKEDHLTELKLSGTMKLNLDRKLCVCVGTPVEAHPQVCDETLHNVVGFIDKFKGVSKKVKYLLFLSLI